MRNNSQGPIMINSVEEKTTRLFDEGDARRLAEASLRAITLATSRVKGDEFFRTLVRELALALDVYYVIAGEVVKTGNREQVKTFAVSAGGEFIPNITYDLAGTPCRNVADQAMCFHPFKIQAEYPEDTLLVDMKAESYIGMPMVGSDGATLGILVALDVRPIDENKRLLALSLLSIFSARCAAEIEHLRREEQLATLVEQRTRALEDARKKLVEQEKLAALGGLVAGLAHEINTPIGIAVTAASTLESIAQQLLTAVNGQNITRTALKEMAAMVNEGSVMVLRNLERAAELVASFKQLAATRSSDDLLDFDFGDYLQRLSAAHGSALKQCSAHCVIEVPTQLKVRLPAEMLTQILSNLLANALIHGFDGRPGGTVTLSAEPLGSTLRFAVTDDGAGVTPEVRERMLEPFFTTRRGKGSIGLGLHIVYTLVQRLGGTLDITSRPDSGLSVEITLPGCVVSAA